MYTGTDDDSSKVHVDLPDPAGENYETYLKIYFTL